MQQNEQQTSAGVVLRIRIRCEMQKERNAEPDADRPLRWDGRLTDHGGGALAYWTDTIRDGADLEYNATAPSTI